MTLDRLTVDFREAQIRAGVTFDNTLAFLGEIEPKKEQYDQQKLLIDTLMDMISLLEIKDPDERKKHIRVVMVYGAEGRGKSYICSGFLNEVLRKYYNAEKDLDGRCLYLTHFELDLKDKSCMNPKAERTQYEQYSKVTTIPYLVIDEIGRGSWSDYTSQNIESVISKRYAQMLPTVLITNKTLPEIVKMFDRSTRDRIFNNKTGVGIDMDARGSASLR